MEGLSCDWWFGGRTIPPVTDATLEPEEAWREAIAHLEPHSPPTEERHHG